ncbi:MAG: hypothetical protein ACE5GF_01465, partial [Thermodesulfobacteriota bacterium]
FITHFLAQLVVGTCWAAYIIVSLEGVQCFLNVGEGDVNIKKGLYRIAEGLGCIEMFIREFEQT